MMYKIRKDKLLLNPQLPDVENQGRIWSKLKKNGKVLHTINKSLSKCHDAAQRLFNFQRNSMIICVENEQGKGKESIEVGEKKYEFHVNRYSVVNSLILWDFEALVKGDQDLQSANDASPYLSLTPDQWTQGLNAERTGRAFMMYKPVAVKTLKNCQGENKLKLARNLEIIHNQSKLRKLILTEYIYQMRTALINGEKFQGREVKEALEKNPKNKKLFAKIPHYLNKFQLDEFILNPASTSNWKDLIQES